MTRHLLVALLLLPGLVAAPGVLGAQEEGLEGSLSGSFKSSFFLVRDADFRETTAGIASNSLRLSGSLYPSEWLALEGAYRIFPEVRSPTPAEGAMLAPKAPVAEYRVADLPPRAFPPEEGSVDNAAIYQDLDRAFAGITLPFADIDLGRQAISWGTARVVRPTDVIVPFSFAEVDTEYRRGVDAARVRIPIGSFNEIEAGAIFGEDFAPEQSAFYLRPGFYLWETDLAFLGMVFRENLLGGLSVSRAIGEAGAWAEAAYVAPNGAGGASESSADDYLTASVGADRNLDSDVYGYVEYHFNGAGARSPGDYLSTATGPAYNAGNVYLLGRHYMAVGGTYSAAPLLPMDALVVVNLTDGSGELTFSAEYNFKENVYVSGGLILGVGPEPETVGGVPRRYRSEFGAYPEVFYTRVKLYF
ncbi:MAG: hypothetical protein ACOCW6_09535 [Spirochaetota bacterium]